MERHRLIFGHEDQVARPDAQSEIGAHDVGLEHEEHACAQDEVGSRPAARPGRADMGRQVAAAVAVREVVDDRETGLVDRAPDALELSCLQARAHGREQVGGGAGMSAAEDSPVLVTEPGQNDVESAEWAPDGSSILV